MFSLILDYYINYYFNNHIMTCIFLINIISYIYFFSNKKVLYIVIFIGILYDLLFSNILFLHIINFYILYNLINYMKNKFHISYFSYLLTLIISIIISYISIFLCLYVLGIIYFDIKYVIIVFKYLISSVIISPIIFLIYKKISK